jgi:hypothetical protein
VNRTPGPDAPAPAWGTVMPVDTAPLFDPLARELVALLRRLEPREWLLPTSAGAWTVRDVAAHLLDGDLRRISAERDGHAAPPPAGGIPDGAALVQFLDTLNADWVAVSGRLSTGLITELLEWSGPILARLMLESDPHGPAIFPVAWAVRPDAPRWLDTGREYTERWHHQDQIREAVGAPPLDDPAWLRPVHRRVAVRRPARVRVPATRPTAPPSSSTPAGPAGAAWSHRERRHRAGSWSRRCEAMPTAGYAVPALLLARLLLHRLPDDAMRDGRFDVTGDTALARAAARAHARSWFGLPQRPATA